MAELPQPIQRLYDVFSTARIAHEYIADTHRELVELHADDARSRALLRDSAAVVFEELPRITRQLQEQERAWDEQQLLDPDAAQRTLVSLAAQLDELEPMFAELRNRQALVAAALRRAAEAAREGD